MFAAGITVLEIAQHCKVKAPTVRWHLHAREKYQPGLRAQHHQALAARPKPLTHGSWLQRFEQLAKHLSETGQFPRRDESGARNLADWITTQRRQEYSGQLSQRQIDALNMLGDWRTTNLSRDRDAVWHKRFKQLTAYKQTHSGMPRWRNHSSEEERVLGVWLHNQYRKRLAGKLEADREHMLDSAFPGWKSYT